jgi:glycosyltransferase involved in cell wall biosynthesis
VNEQIRDELRESVPEMPADRFVVIPNGFDPADFAGLNRNPAPRWTIAHVGSIFASRVPYTFLRVLEDWLEREPARIDQFRLRLVGRVCPEMLDRVSQEPLSRVVVHDGYLSHRESVQAMIDADLLLLLTNEETHDPGMITGKLFEYLGADRPILALTLPGEASRILEETNAGYAVPPKDASAIRTVLETVHGNTHSVSTMNVEVIDRSLNPNEGKESSADSGSKPNGVGMGTAPDRDWDSVARYSRPVQAKRLAETLDAVATEARSRANGPLHD